ncbi:MAG: LeuA family protein [Neisseriaceae bacterium]
MKHINLFDTTLRDGEQAIGFDLNVKQRAYIFNLLNSLHLNTIEFGMSNSGTEADLTKFIDSISLNSVNAQVCLLSRLVDSDIKIGAKVLNHFKHSRLQLLGVGSHIHLYKKIRIGEDKLFEIYKRSINLLQDHYNGDITFILEDASRCDLGFLFKQIEFLLASGIKGICFADTVGCMTPSQVKRIFLKIKSKFGHDISLSCHFHNDIGLATANTLAAIETGAVEEIQCTSGGIGERCGNSSLEEIIGILQLKDEYKSKYQVDVDLNDALNNLVYMFKFLKKDIYPYKPLIGKYAFTTAAGIHQDGITKDPETYSFFDPKLLSRKLEFVVNKLSSTKLLKNIQQ